MKNILGLFLASSLIGVSGYAAEVEHTQEKESKFYVAAKALMTLGNTVNEGESQLKGSTGKGIGIDLGYRVGNGFAVEVDGTYTKNTVTEIPSVGEEEDFTGSYMTSSLDAVYDYKFTHELAIFGKAGFEYELEKIGDAASKTSTGISYAVGTEYEVSESIALLAEYEGTTIDGPRGNGVFAGIVYNF